MPKTIRHRPATAQGLGTSPSTKNVQTRDKKGKKVWQEVKRLSVKKGKSMTIRA